MKRDLFSLDNYCSIVTGAAQDLGKYMALALVEAGSNIVIINNAGICKHINA